MPVAARAHALALSRIDSLSYAIWRRLVLDTRRRRVRDFPDIMIDEGFLLAPCLALVY